MKFPGSTKNEVAVFDAAITAVIRHMVRHKSQLPPAVIAERFVSAIKSGERIKALTLGADSIDARQPN